MEPGSRQRRKRSRNLNANATRCTSEKTDRKIGNDLFTYRHNKLTRAQILNVTFRDSVAYIVDDCVTKGRFPLIPGCNERKITGRVRCRETASWITDDVKAHLSSHCSSVHCRRSPVDVAWFHVPHSFSRSHIPAVFKLFWPRTPILLRHSWRTPTLVTVKFTGKY